MANIPTIASIIAREINANVTQVSAAVTLLDEGATVPFIARYRKEVTGGLDDAQLRELETRLVYLRELEDRRSTIIESIDSQEKLTDELRGKLEAATTKTELEDLYLPYRPRRRTRAQIAIEAGILPLAETLFQNTLQEDLETLAAPYIDEEKGFADTKAVLDGARFILIDRISEEAELLGKLRNYLWDNGVISASVKDGKADEGSNYKDYFEFSEAIKTIPSHRALALLRGRNEDILSLDLVLPEPIEETPQTFIKDHFGLSNPHDWLNDTIRLSWRAKLNLSLSLELINRMREEAEAEAIKVFARNLKDLLLASPAGNRVILGIDPGIRTGCKVAVVDDTGKLLDTTTIYPHPPRNDWNGSLTALAALCQKHSPSLIAIGNGTASRETDKLAGELCKVVKGLSRIVVSEAGASVYSASELASKEFPELDVSLRGAISIARRLQDPLAELVKIDPKSIGVGQYQHDVNQTELNRSLASVVEDCVNAVGVDVNTASSPLLAQVSGLNNTTAENIVKYRDENGAFTNRKELLKVPRLGPKTFELAAGFLRIRGNNPLDRSAVHPEAYPVVETIAKKTAKSIDELIGNTSLLRSLNPKEFTSEKFGIPTVKDIIDELDKPGRDPRPEFVTATFKEGIESIKDLKEGMRLEGVVTNVANFGAFVDIGVHQDGLVHISALADRFVKDPHEIVKVGDVVTVKVLEVDIPRNRIQLTMRMNDDASASDKGQKSYVPAKGKQAKRHSEKPSNNPFADALKGLKR
ncbi:Tex family protein [Ignatzschineria sp. RMDPL8A]|uniref:Tex family protein n=1 Tax=Ignatzschineria sp. RMDPL8A TaxID=2999236 RepID=UPI0024467A32|nr:Tex family protein [Ignatzschineria sp. RMDPL8A]MDG9729585.1 Tex family protein [Ignatzschineria sp. RMDPL8A]